MRELILISVIDDSFDPRTILNTVLPDFGRVNDFGVECKSKDIKKKFESKGYFSQTRKKSKNSFRPTLDYLFLSKLIMK